MACVPFFEVGPLRLTGDKALPDLSDWPSVMQERSAEKLAKGDASTKALVSLKNNQEKYAILDLSVTLKQQRFLLNGKIEIFDLLVYADIECQYKPIPKFQLDFSLQWNDLIALQLHAQMLDNKCLDRPRDADFEVSATVEQTVVTQITHTLTAVFRTTSETLSKGVGAAKAEIVQLEGKKRQLLEVAVQSLSQAEAELAIEKSGIEQSILDNERQTLERGQQLEKVKAEIESRSFQRQLEAKNRREMQEQAARDRKNAQEANERALLAKLANDRRTKEAQREEQRRKMKNMFDGISRESILLAVDKVLPALRGKTLPAYSWHKLCHDSANQTMQPPKTGNGQNMTESTVFGTRK